MSSIIDVHEDNTETYEPITSEKNTTYYFKGYIPTISTDGQIYINAVNQITIFLVTNIIIWNCVSLKLKRTAMHSFLCTLGAVFFLSEGIMTSYGGNAFFHSLRFSVKILLHITFNVAATVLIGSGIVCKYKRKRLHFYTSHGKFGVAAFLFLCLNIVCGMCFFFITTSRIIALFHSLLGICAFVASFVAQVTGYETGFFHRNFYYITLFKALSALIVLLSFDSLFEYVIDLIILVYMY